MPERIIYKKYGPGKFGDSVDEWLYEQSLDFTDDEAGDVSEIGTWNALLLFDKPVEVQETIGEKKRIWEFRAAILEETDSGFVYAKTFRTHKEAQEHWEAILGEIEKLYNEMEEEHEADPWDVHPDIEEYLGEEDEE